MHTSLLCRVNATTGRWIHSYRHSCRKYGDIENPTSRTASIPQYVYTTTPQRPLSAMTFSDICCHSVFSQSLNSCQSPQGTFWASDGTCTQHIFSSKWKMNKRAHLDIWPSIYMDAELVFIKFFLPLYLTFSFCAEFLQFINCHLKSP